MSGNKAAGVAGQVARFGIVGGAATATHYMVAAGVTAVIDAYTANLAGYLAAFGLSYHGHKRWTFGLRHAEPLAHRPLARFLAISLSALGLSELVLHFGLVVLDLGHPTALLPAVLVVPPATFIAARSWVFGPD